MLSIAGLEISFHRMGLAGWASCGVLRSWADAPWQSSGGDIALACLPDEAIWLGFTNTAEPTTVALTTLEGQARRSLHVPPEWQLGWLVGCEGRGEPLTLGKDSAITYRLDLRLGSPPSTLTLLSPTAWADRFEPIDLHPVHVPPPVPMYSRIARPRRPMT